MIYVMTIGSIAMVVLAIVGVTAAWLLARAMDRANGKALFKCSRWGEVISRLESDPMAAAVYYGARWVGICLLIGFLFSRAV